MHSDCYEQFLHNSTESLADSWQACQRWCKCLQHDRLNTWTKPFFLQFSESSIANAASGHFWTYSGGENLEHLTVKVTSQSSSAIIANFLKECVRMIGPVNGVELQKGQKGQ